MHFDFTSEGNTGSCGDYANYLDKEITNEYYNGQEKGVQREQVQKEIDRNSRGQLGKNDWKFLGGSYNPSQKEIQHLIKHETGREVSQWNELTPQEQEQVKGAFSDYVRDCQDIQAKNYGRDNIQGESDLKWYAKNETERKYKGFDKEVQQGQAKSGDLKKGLHLHAHIIQSRKATDRRTKLSPLTNYKTASKKNHVKQGFDRHQFAIDIEKQFDKKFSYNRELSEKYEYKNAQKFNRREEMERIKMEYEKEKGITQNKGVSRDFVIKQRERLKNSKERQKSQENSIKSNNMEKTQGQKLKPEQQTAFDKAKAKREEKQREQNQRKNRGFRR